MDKNKCFLVLLSVGVFLLAGCASKTEFPAPEPLCSGLSLDDAMQVGEDVLGNLRFPIAKYDADAALIQTGPYEGAHFFEFWRSDDASAYDRAYSNVHSVQRIAELSFDQQADRLCISCRVDLQRLSLPEGEITGSAKTFSLFSESEETRQTLQVNSEQKEGMAWLDMGQDNKLAAKILKRIEKKISRLKK